MSRNVRIPASAESEASVLGAILLKPSVVGWLDVEPEDFFDLRNREVFLAARAVWLRDGTLDEVMLADELQRRQSLARVGGYERLQQIALTVPTAANVEHYVGEIHRKRVTREAMTALSEVQKLISDGLEGDELLGAMYERLTGIEARGKDDEMRSLFEVCRKEIEQAARDIETGRRPCAPSGIDIFDRKVGGFPDGLMAIIGARAGTGKSAFALTVAEACSVAHIPGLIFTWEDEEEGFGQRSLSNHGGVTASDIRNRNLDRDAIGQLWGAMTAIKNRRQVFLGKRHGKTLERTLRLARSQRRRLGGQRVVYLFDYLQKIPTAEKFRTDRERIAYVSRRLSEFAGEEGCPVIAMAQLNRDCEKERRPPRESDLRECGNIEEDAKVIVLLYDPTKVDEEKRPIKLDDPSKYLGISCVKNHQGPQGEFVARFDRKYLRIR